MRVELGRGDHLRQLLHVYGLDVHDVWRHTVKAGARQLRPRPRERQAGKTHREREEWTRKGGDHTDGVQGNTPGRGPVSPKRRSDHGAAAQQARTTAATNVPQDVHGKITRA